MADQQEESATEAWRRIRETTKNPKHWPKPRKDPKRPTVAETVAQIKDRQEKETNHE